MTVAHPANSQYDDDSAPNKNYNCGPTTITNVIIYQNGRDYGIEATRNLATSRNGTGTTLAERKLMLERRGVPATRHNVSFATLKTMLNGTRTYDVALLMSKIPLSIRKRPFAGSHSVEALSNGVVNGVSGIYVYNPDYRRDKDSARYFYPDRYFREAYEALGRWSVGPTYQRVVPTRKAYVRSHKTTAGVNLRTGPGTAYKSIKVVAAGFAFRSIQIETKGGKYVANGATRTDWLSLNYDGRLVWVARGFTKEV